MSKVLYIKANPKPFEESKTFQLAHEFIDKYKKHNPSDDISLIDLYKKDVKFLNLDMINKMFAGTDNEMLYEAKKFAEFDKYIFAAPMWNLGIPAILKAYFDYITYIGVTFKYTDDGPIGLLKNKKAAHIVTRGGIYSEGEGAMNELGDKYVRKMLNFYGITDIITVKLDGTNIFVGEELENAKNKAYELAKELALEF